MTWYLNGLPNVFGSLIEELFGMQLLRTNFQDQIVVLRVVRFIESRRIVEVGRQMNKVADLW